MITIIFYDQEKEKQRMKNGKLIGALMAVVLSTILILQNTQAVGQNKKEVVIKGFVQDIGALATKNVEFRRVLYTAKHCQLVVMALKPKEEIGAEVHHKLDQFFRVEEGSGEAVLDGVRTAIHAGFAVVVPAGMNHNIINTGSVPLKLYTLYAPPNHRDGVVHPTRADAEADNEHFDGKTTE
jgi:mannose-6-phosphate isomerase-like protein (cupin superfamily)